MLHFDVGFHSSFRISSEDGEDDVEYAANCESVDGYHRGVEADEFSFEAET